jgi:hypothetical protein
MVAACAGALAMVGCSDAPSSPMSQPTADAAVGPVNQPTPDAAPGPVNQPTADGGSMSADTSPPPPPPPPPPPAGPILIGERFNTPDGRVMYMGAFPEMPKQPVNITQLVELGPEGDVFGCGGNAFVYNPAAGSITKYTVGPDLKLTKGTSIDVLLEGIEGWTGAHVCVSPTQAFIFNESGGRVVEWNPMTMVVVNGFDVPKPEVAAGLDIQFFEPFIADKLVYFPVGAIDWDTSATATRSILAVFDISQKTLSFTYDNRCQPSLGGFVDSRGNFYKLPEDGGYFRLFSPTKNLPPDCILRVPAGGKTFDPAFILPLETGESLRAMWPIDDDHVLATLIYDKDAPPADKSDDWWSLPVKPTMINVKTGARTPYTSVPTVQPMNGRKLVVAGKSYYQVYTFDDKKRVAKVDVVHLTVAGAQPAFTLMGGDVLTLELLR